MTESKVMEHIVEALANTGYLVLDNALPVSLICQLQARVRGLSIEDMRRAGVGRQHQHQLTDAYRTDHIAWLGREDAAEAAYLDWMERLRLAINQQLFMGLFDYECHFALYQPGDYYKKHLDAFHGNTNRVVTTVLYLNQAWQQSEGGELVMYAEQGDVALQRILPCAGCLVVFLSDRYPHEVLEASRIRYSIAGWFRVNNSSAGRVDPSR